MPCWLSSDDMESYCIPANCPYFDPPPPKKKKGGGGGNKSNLQCVPIFAKICLDYKSGNIRSTLIFANRAKFSKRELKNPRKYLQYFVCVWVLMQMGNILENVWGLLCFCAAQLLLNVSYDVKYLCNTKISSEHLLSANSTTREYVFMLPNAKINPAKLSVLIQYSTCI